MAYDFTLHDAHNNRFFPNELGQTFVIDGLNAQEPQKAFTFDTTTSTTTTFATIPTSEGYSYFFELWLSSADVASAEANECVTRSLAVYTYAPGKSLALRDSSIILASSSAVVPTFAVSGSNILLQVDPIDGTDRRHYGFFCFDVLKLERYPS